MLLLKLFFYKLQLDDIYAVLLVFFLFTIFIVLNLKFGGGDIRFGVFCALFLGLHPLGWFILLSGILQIIFLYLTKKETFAFAPAMSLATVVSYFIVNI